MYTSWRDSASLVIIIREVTEENTYITAIPTSNSLAGVTVCFMETMVIANVGTRDSRNALPMMAFCSVNPGIILTV